MKLSPLSKHKTQTYHNMFPEFICFIQSSTVGSLQIFILINSACSSELKKSTSFWTNSFEEINIINEWMDVDVYWQSSMMGNIFFTSSVYFKSQKAYQKFANIYNDCGIVHEVHVILINKDCDYFQCSAFISHIVCHVFRSIGIFFEKEHCS